MNHLNPNFPPPPLPENLSPPERVRIIRRSLRCASYGELGAVPIVGLPAAISVLVIYRQISRQTGEPWRHRQLNVELALCVLTSCLMLAGGEWAEAILLLLFAFSFQFLVTYRYLQKEKARYWNPARRELFYGLANAYIGIHSSICLLLVIVMAHAGWLD
jgi:hypothetical protein